MSGPPSSRSAGDAGLILACAGCCCGHPAHGGALSPQRTLKALARRAFKAAGLDGHVRLAFTECLGPCGEANVMLLYLHGRPLWFRRMNAPDVLTALLDYCRAAVTDGPPPLPPELATRSFSWTGGGLGPVPPPYEADSIRGVSRSGLTRGARP